MTQTFSHPIGRLTHRLRRFWCNLLPAIGIRDFVMPAQGARFRINNVDLIDRHIGWDAMWEPVQMERLAGLCRERRFDLFLDIGANTGFYSVMFAIKHLTPDVIAFEPDPRNRTRLIDNLRLNRLEHAVKVMPYALGDRKQTARLTQSAEENRGESWLDHEDQPAGSVTLEVDERRFDDEFVIKGKDLIVKMDVEGYEFRTLAGMERTLRENRCFLQVELYSPHIERLKNLFAGFGYRYLDTFEIDHYFTNIPDLR